MEKLRAIVYGVLLLLVSYVVLTYGKPILAPVVFAGFFTLMLAPMCGWLERRKMGSLGSILLCFLIILLPIVLVISFFSVQLYDIFQSLPSIRQDLEAGLAQVLGWVQERFGIAPSESEDWLRQNVRKGFDSALGFVGSGLSSSGVLLTNVLLVLVYTFLLLYYRASFRQFAILQFKKSRQNKVASLIERIQNVVKSYFFGLLLVIIILGILNTLGLWLIGIKYAAFWGCLAAMLAIIPYIGTTLGGTLPFLYALVTTGTFWQPAAVVLLYAGIQQLEGNFITPNVVGSSIKINPLVVIFSMIVGGFIWGIAGLIIVLPTVAILRLILLEISPMKPLALLMDNSIRKNGRLFKSELNYDQYRLIHLFKIKNK